MNKVTCDQVVVDKINSLSSYEKESLFELIPSEYIAGDILDSKFVSRLHSTIRMYAVKHNIDPEVSVKTSSFSLLCKAVVYTSTNLNLEKIYNHLFDDNCFDGFEDAIKDILEHSL